LFFRQPPCRDELLVIAPQKSSDDPAKQTSETDKRRCRSNQERKRSNFHEVRAYQQMQLTISDDDTTPREALHLEEALSRSS
jgi:hypothetical protein